MSFADSTSPRAGRPTWSRAQIVVTATIVGVGALVVGGAIVLLWLFLHDSRSDLQPQNLVPVDGQGGVGLLTGATDVTSEVCGPDFPCESAWGNDDMVLMKFETQDAAAATARALAGDAYRSDWLVAHFVGEHVSAEDRLFAAEALDGTWQGHVD